MIFCYSSCLFFVIICYYCFYIICSVFIFSNFHCSFCIFWFFY